MFQELELAIESGKNVISLQCQLPERIKIIQELTQIARGRQIPCYLWNLGTRTLECVGNSQGRGREAGFDVSAQRSTERSRRSPNGGGGAEGGFPLGLDTLVPLRSTAEGKEAFPLLPAPFPPASFGQKLDLKVTSPLNVVEALAPFSQDGFFILEDLHSFLNESSTDIKSKIAAVQMRSLLINLAFAWADTRKIAVLLGTQETELPSILGSIIPEFWNPLPHYEENVALLSELLPNMGLSADIPQLALSAGGLSQILHQSG